MKVDPEMQEFASLAAARFDAAYEAMPLAEQRRLYAAFCREFDTPRPPGVEVRDTAVQAAHGAIPVRLYRPAGSDPLPAVVYFHGGGWVVGSPATHDSITARLAAEAKVAVVSVDYRLAPEHPFPAPFDDAYGALCAVAATPEPLGIDRHRLAVAGDSAGGNLAAAVALAARDRSGPALRLQALVYPGVSTAFDRPSCWENAEAPFLTRQALVQCVATYLGGRTTSDNPYAMPAAARSHVGLPPAFIATAELDPLRDDGAHYAECLRGAGIEVTYRCAAGLLHGYLRAIGRCQAAQREFLALCAAVVRHLAD